MQHFISMALSFLYPPKHSINRTPTNRSSSLDPPMSILSKDFIGLGIPILDFSILPASEPTDQPPPSVHGTEKSNTGTGSTLSQNQHRTGPLRPGDMGATAEANTRAQAQ